MANVASKQINGAKTYGIILLAMLLLIIAAFIVGLQVKASTKQGAIYTYAECAESKGSVITNTYPSVCTTKDKNAFINTSQQYYCGRAGYATNPNLCRQ